MNSHREVQIYSLEKALTVELLSEVLLIWVMIQVVQSPALWLYLVVMHMFYGLIIHQEFRDTAKKEHWCGSHIWLYN